MPISGISSPGELPSLQYDLDAASDFAIIFHEQTGRVTGKADLQFPPKITTDSKQARWDESHHSGFEELAKFMGAYARRINIELNYVVWGKWDQERIGDAVRRFKWHLYVSAGQTEVVTDKVPFFYIDAWQIIKTDTTERIPAFRLTNVSVEYSREYVGSGKNYWPLHTKVNLDCKLFTLIGSTGAPYWDELKNYACGDIPAKMYIEWA